VALLIWEIAMITTSSRRSLGVPHVDGGLPWTGEVEIDPGMVESIAETFSRLYRCGWNAGGIAVSFYDGECTFVVKGQIGESPVQAKGSTLIEALQQSLANARMLNTRSSGGTSLAAG
jgi:hypothetical protein